MSKLKKKRSKWSNDSFLRHVSSLRSMNCLDLSPTTSSSLRQLLSSWTRQLRTSDFSMTNMWLSQKSCLSSSPRSTEIRHLPKTQTSSSRLSSTSKTISSTGKALLKLTSLRAACKRKSARLRRLSSVKTQKKRRNSLSLLKLLLLDSNKRNARSVLVRRSQTLPSLVLEPKLRINVM